ncbi:MAG: large conductance mechanosensitive channel protein MscL [Frankiaceae bacterium]
MDGFRKFILRGNVVDLAVGIVVGAAFGLVVTSFVAAFLTPLIGLLTPAKDLAKATFHAAGTRWPYGAFVTAVISFLLIAAAVYFLVVLPLNRLHDRYKTEPDVVTPTRDCPYCLSAIPVAATRCAFCTSELGAAA